MQVYNSIDDSIPYNIDSCPILIDKIQPIRSLEYWSRNKEYKARQIYIF